MQHEVLEQLKARYALEREMQSLDNQIPELEQEVESSENIFLVLVDAMTARERNLIVILKKLFGKIDDELAELVEEATLAEEQMDQAAEALEACRNARKEARSRLASLPSVATLRARAKKDPETSRAFADLDIRYCVEQLLPLMDENIRIIKEYRDCLPHLHDRENFSQSEANRIYKAVVEAPNPSLPLLARLELGAEMIGAEFRVMAYYAHAKEFFLGNFLVATSDERKCEIALKEIDAQKRQIKYVISILDGTIYNPLADL